MSGHLLRPFLLPSICAVVLLTIPLRAVIWKVGNLFENVTGGPRLSDFSLLHALVDYVNANLGLLDLPNLICHGLILGLSMGFAGILLAGSSPSGTGTLSTGSTREAP